MDADRLRHHCPAAGDPLSDNRRQLRGAFLAAQTVAEFSIKAWNPVKETREPRSELAERYDELYASYLDLYTTTRAIAHALAARQER